VQNPQYKVIISSQNARTAKEGVLRVLLEGEKALAWNVKLLWGKGELVHE
jgi:hypothetical protein